MKFSRILLGLVSLVSIQNVFAIPVTYEFSATYQREVRGDPLLDVFTTVSPGEQIYSDGLSISGSFTYDSDFPTVEFPGTGIGLSLGAGTNFSATLDGNTVTDNNLSPLIADNSAGVGGVEDYVGFYADPQVGVPLPRDLMNGFNITNGSGTEFALFNFRFNWLQSGQSDFVSSILENPSVLPPPGHDGSSNLAVDFLVVNPDGTLNESIQQIVFFDNLSVTPVPIPASVLLFGSGLALLGFGCKRRRAV